MGNRRPKKTPAKLCSVCENLANMKRVLYNGITEDTSNRDLEETRKKISRIAKIH